MVDNDFSWIIKRSHEYVDQIKDEYHEYPLPNLLSTIGREYGKQGLLKLCMQKKTRVSEIGIPKKEMEFAILNYELLLSLIEAQDVSSVCGVAAESLAMVLGNDLSEYVNSECQKLIIGGRESIRSQFANHQIKQFVALKLFQDDWKLKLQLNLQWLNGRNSFHHYYSQGLLYLLMQKKHEALESFVKAQELTAHDDTYIRPLVCSYIEVLSGGKKGLDENIKDYIKQYDIACQSEYPKGLKDIPEEAYSLDGYIFQKNMHILGVQLDINYDKINCLLNSK